ncbi:MAG: TRAP transporter substrate-binding protein [Hyphomicrobiales bacterium]|nr:TRAP transporter substrate-binding protein [Hyphomicrobiales bacterium]
MLGRILRCLLPLLAVVAFHASAQPVKLKFAIFTPDKEMTFVTTFKPFADAVNRDGQGTVQIDLYPNGALGRNPMAQAQMVLDGVADIAWVVTSYTPGRFHENELLELPGLFRDLREATLAYTRLVRGGILKGHEDYYPIGLFGTAPYSVHGRFPINSVADLKGKKIRVSGAMESASLKALGAVPVGMPITEVAEALSRGTIDGSTAHPSVLFDFGVVRVTTSHYFTRLGSVPIAMLMNRKKFDSLPQAAKDIIARHSGEASAKNFIDGINRYNDALVKKMQADSSRKVVFPSPADLEAVQGTLKTVISEWAGRSPRNRELLNAMENELAKIRSGR